MERECEITLLTYEQILGKKKLKIFDKIDVSALASASAVITDFAILLVGEFDFLNFNDSNLTEKTYSYFTESSYCYGGQKNEVGIIERDGKWIWHKIDDWKIRVRPALTFPKNLFIPKKKNRNEFLEIEYGFYLKMINEEINTIKKLDFNNEYINIIENLLNNELNNLGDIKTTIKTLTDILCKLYEIEIQIKEKQIAKENIKKYRITRKFNRLTVI